MVVWLIGIAEILLGTIEQFLVNESRIIAGAILIVGCALLFGLKKRKTAFSPWQLYLLRIVTLLHVIGIFSDRWLVYTGLGILTAAAGIILTFAAYFSTKRSTLLQKSARSRCLSLWGCWHL